MAHRSGNKSGLTTNRSGNEGGRKGAEMGKAKGEREVGVHHAVCTGTQTTSINKTRGTGSISTFRHSREKKQRKQRSQGDRARTQKTKYMSVKKYRQQAPSPTACSLQVHTWCVWYTQGTGIHSRGAEVSHGKLSLSLHCYFLIN